MIKVNYAQIRHRDFNPVLRKILSAKMPFDSAKRMLEILQKIKAEQEKSDELWKMIVGRYLTQVPGEPEMMRIKEELTAAEVEEAKSMIEKFHQTEVKIDQAQVLPKELGELNLSPIELLHLKGIVESV